MVCAPCQRKAEARRQAMLQQVAKSNPKWAEAFNANTTAAANLWPKTTRVLPRYEAWKWQWAPITNTQVKSNTVWNAWYQAFMMNKSK